MSNFGRVIRTEVVAIGVCGVSASVFFVVGRTSVGTLFVTDGFTDVPPRVLAVALPLEDCSTFSCSKRTLRACFGAGGADRGGVDGLDIADITVVGRCEPPRHGDVVR